MPRHDYSCACGATLRDVYRPVTERASDRPPTCPHCCLPMAWIPAIGRMSLIQESTREVIPFTQPDGSIRYETVSSIADIRRLERESEQRYRNGEGAPFRWRDYSQDVSNRDQNLFGPDPSQRPDPTFVREKVGVGGLGTLDESAAEDLPLGPGVSSDSVSPLSE